MLNHTLLDQVVEARRASSTAIAEATRKADAAREKQTRAEAEAAHRLAQLVETHAALEATHDAETRTARQIARHFLDYDVWLTPTLGSPPVPLGHFDPVPGNPYNPLDKILGGILRIFKNNDIVPLGIYHGDPGSPAQGVFHAIAKFVDQDVIADHQGGNHRTGGDLESLHHKGSDKKCEQQGDHNCLDIFSHHGFFHDLAGIFLQHA